MPERAYRVYNHTDRELIVATDVGGAQQYRLFPQSVSPADERPRLLWAAAPGVEIDGSALWGLDEGFDVHVSEAGSDSSLGASAPGVTNPLEQTANLHISGLGIHALGPSLPVPTDRAVWFFRDDEIWVTVLGAGITGLTAAHELVARGFRVQVIERAHGSPADLADYQPSKPYRPPSDASPDEPAIERFRRGLTRPDIGGIARTQWGTQPLERAGIGVLQSQHADDDSPPGASDWPETPASLRSVHGDAVWFGAHATGPCHMESYHAFPITWTDGKVDDLSERLCTWLAELSTVEGRSIAAAQLVVVVYGGNAPGRVERSYQRFHEFLATIRTGNPDQRTKWQKTLRTTLDRLQVLPTARIDVAEPEPDKKTQYVGLMMRTHEDLGLIAGEHGFRFFPGFYRHLRDTMERTPIFDPLTRTFTPRTARDNLQEVVWQVIADPTRRNRTALSRKPFGTIGGLVDQYRALRRDLGYRPIDLLRVALRTLRYMTSSTRRRKAHYESMTWFSFLTRCHLDDPSDKKVFTFGERFTEALRHAPRALVAMDPEHADARTQGNITIQLLMDQFALHDQSDSTLAGPTSTTWLSHWRTYLEEQGVRFFLGEVTAIFEKAGRAKIAIAFPDGLTPREYLDGEANLQRIRDHYIVSALDLVSLARVATSLRNRGAHGKPGVLDDLNRLIRDHDGRDRDLEDIRQIGQHGPDGGLGDRFQTLTGIQLYYKHHVSFANGHIYFAGTPWGLSAISQVQFWGPFGSGHRGRLFGNLSIDIGSWRAGKRLRSPNCLGRDKIAALVQEQIDGCTLAPDQASLRRAIYYHLDDFIGFGPAPPDDPKKHHDEAAPAYVPTRNYAPFLINVKDEWNLRPRGEPWSPNDLVSRGRVAGDGTDDGPIWTPARDGYPVYHGNLVLAGTHMRTFTRMATMEAANESARHAVNTILDHATSKAKRAMDVPDADVLRVDSGRPPIDAFRVDGYQPNPDVNVEKNTTLFGDYCDIWNPELFEFQDLEFLRLIDSHLMEAGSRTAGDDTPEHSHPRLAPHLFDILRIDELPEFLENDREVVNALEMIGATLKAFDDARVDDLPSVLHVIERARKKLAGLFERSAR